ncbi:Chloramphenicol acetyltransferase-like domain-containing protein [Cynara cardunculus var. scolymus]|uniref:Chloramphenicol acetyltransferase-like domain-containing protein n=1 Tax=Cynara cardunculus var. scolymus TaxID=59895 RepID=A0A124SDX9_CYNCS|nr:Chloramphenicol acetyltransferase-like domain-containing protein [Cynara cardunculus var. scolymus]
MKCTDASCIQQQGGVINQYMADIHRGYNTSRGDCFVKPKILSEEAKKPIYFSPWDLPLFSFNYIQKGLLFRLPENQDFSIATFLDDLKDSLSATLTYFHPLAARLATVKQQKPPSLVAFLDHENSPGARFIHSTVDLRISDVLEPTDVPLIVQSFFDHHEAISHDGHQLSLLSIQVTELIDGIFIGCSINHMVADGTSYWQFFNSWSEVFRSKTQNGHLAPVSRPPILERLIPAGSDPIISLPFTDDDELIERYSPPFLRERIFHFSSDSLSKLKAKVNSDCNTTKISTLQGLSALVWRCVTRARQLPADQETGCRLAFLDPNSVHMGSSPRFDMYGNEFGLGKGVAVLSGFANKFDGKMTLYPGRDGGGSMDLEVCLLPENMAAFESDEEFLSVVS